MAEQEKMLPCPMYADERLPEIARRLRRLADLVGIEHMSDASMALGDANYLDDLPEAIRRPAVPPAGAWMPIKSAPKDGTPILIWDPSQGGPEHYMPDGALRENEHRYTTADPRLKWYDDRRYAIGYWRPWAVVGKTSHPYGNRNSASPEPTLWQPLPSPPGEDDSSAAVAAPRPSKKTPRSALSAELQAVLADIEEYLQGHHDIRDGVPGGPHPLPNEAMSLSTALKCALGELP